MKSYAAPKAWAVSDQEYISDPKIQDQMAKENSLAEKITTRDREVLGTENICLSCFLTCHAQLYPRQDKFYRRNVFRHL